MTIIKGIRASLLLILLATTIIAASPVSAATWTGGGGVYSDTTKWDTGVAPCGPTDDVVFPDGVYTVTLDLACTVGTLDHGNRVNLQVTSALVYGVAGVATIRGSVYVTASGGEFLAPNAVFPGAAAGQIILASNDGVIDLSGLATLNPPTVSTSRIEIDLSSGGSVDLSGLATISGTGGYTFLEVHSDSTLTLPSLTTAEDVLFWATSGGRVEVNGISQSVAYSATGLVNAHHTLMYATGAGSVLDLSAIVSIDDGHSHGTGALNHYITGELGGVVNLSGLTGLTIPVNSNDLLRFRGLSGGSIDLSSLAVIPGTGGYTWIEAQSGSTLSLPSLTTAEDVLFWATSGGRIEVNGASQSVAYSATGLVNAHHTLMYATGTDSVLDMSAIVSIDDGHSHGSGALSHYITGELGGVVNLSGLTGLTMPVNSNDLLRLRGLSGGSIDLSSLAVIPGAGGYTKIEAESGSTLSLPSLATAEDVLFWAQGGGRIEVNGAGQSVAYSATGLVNAHHTLMYATGTDSVLDMSAIVSIDDGHSHGSGALSHYITGELGGVVNLSGLTGLTMPVNSNDLLRLRGLSGGSIDLSSLAVIPGAGGYTKIEAESGSVLSLPSLTTAEDVLFWATSGGRIEVNGAGQSVAYSAIGLVNDHHTLLYATGAGSVLDLSAIVSIDDGHSHGTGALSHYITAELGGVINLSGLEMILAPANSEDILRFTGTVNSSLNISALGRIEGPGRASLSLDQSSIATVGSLLFETSFDVTVSTLSSLQAADLVADPNGTGVFLLSDAGIILDVNGTLDLGDDVLLTISEPNTRLNLGGRFLHSNQTPADIQLESAIVHFDGTATQRMETGGADVGASPPVSPNFGVGQIIVGQTGQPTIVQLEDLIDNGSGGGGTGALYLLGLDPGIDPAISTTSRGLRIDGGSTLNLGCLPVYVCDDNTDTLCEPLLDQFDPPEVISISYDNGFVQIDGDDDGDGIPTCLDNCPRTPNAEQGDADEDGIGDHCDFVVPLDTPAYVVDIPGLGSESETGASLATGGDLNSDGIEDFLVGAPGYSDGVALEAGAVGVYFGSVDVTERGVPEVVFTGIDAHDRTGVSVAGNFDFDGDGRPEILIGAEQVNRMPEDDPVAGCNAGEPCGAGKVYLIYFDPTDTVLYPNIGNPLVEDYIDLAGVGTTVPGVVFVGVSLGDMTGFAVAAGGRVNAGAGQDILIGAPGWNSGAGTTYLIFDDAALSGAVSLARVANGLGDEVAGIRYEGATAGDEVGFSVAFPGDVVDDPNVVNDTGDDVAFGAPGTDTSEPGAGVLYIHAGGSLITDIVEPVSIGGDKPGTKVRGRQQQEGLGFSVAGGGDNLVDGSDDLLIGAPFYDRGSSIQENDAGRVIQTAAKLPNGSVDVDSIGAGAGEPGAIPGVIYVGAAGFDHLGEAVAGLRDVTKDGFADIAFSAPLADPDGILNAGTIYLSPGFAPPPDFHLGVIDLARGFAGTQFTGIQVGETAGKALAGVGDIEGDGDNDFLAGAPGNDSAVLGIDAGVVYTIVDCTEVDTDGDGFVDCDDNCPLAFNPGQEDTDNGGVGDGVGDVCDNCPAIDNTFQADVDHDGLGDICDGCPRDFNPGQENVDLDGTQDACDNCPDVSNASQRDLDDDAIGDACEFNPVFYVSMDPIDNPDFGMIQDAIDEAQVSGTSIEVRPKSGGSCYGDPDTSIVINSNLNLQLIGDGTDVCVGSANTAAIEVLSSGVGSVLLQNLQIEGLIGVRATASLDVRNVRFRNIADVALKLEAGFHLISDIDMDSSVENGIDLWGFATMVVERAALDGLTGTAMNVDGVADVGTALVARTSGGIVLGGNATLTLRHSTVADNSNPGINRTGDAAVLVEHSILWGNMGGDTIGVGCDEIFWSLTGAPNCTGSGDNLSCPPDFVAVDPISPADPTRYYHLQATSCALEHGPDPATYTGVPCGDLDGVQRLLDYDGNGLAHVDIGAYEMMMPGLMASLVTGVMWVDDATMWWIGHADATEYHIYRETIATLGYDSYGICHDTSDPDRTDTMLAEPDAPALGEAWIYTVTIEDGVDEQSLGLGTCAERSNFTPCP